MNKKITLAVAATAVAGLMALVGAPLLSQSRAASQETIQGVWRVTEVTTTGPNASTNKSPQPSLYIFTCLSGSQARLSQQGCCRCLVFHRSKADFSNRKNVLWVATML